MKNLKNVRVRSKTEVKPLKNGDYTCPLCKQPIKGARYALRKEWVCELCWEDYIERV